MDIFIDIFMYLNFLSGDKLEIDRYVNFYDLIVCEV